jgi:hypothetical protein
MRAMCCIKNSWPHSKFRDVGSRPVDLTHPKAGLGIVALRSEGRACFQPRRVGAR